MSFRIINADVRDGLRQLEANTVHAVITSPPYWSLRDYGTPGQLGLEPTAKEYLETMVDVFREVRRVLHPSGSVWLNVGDSYCSDAGVEREPTTLAGPRVPSGWTNRAQTHRAHAIRKKQDVDPKRGGQCGDSAIYKGIRPQDYLKPKDLCMMPARLAIALQQDGWYLRAQMPWLKKNGMPESTTDRPVSSIEYIYLLTKSPDYFYDREAVRVKASDLSHDRGNGIHPKAMGPNSRMRRDQDPAHQTDAKIRGKQNRSFSAAVNGVVAIRARRTSDWFFASLETISPKFKGMLVDASANPLAMIVNPQSFSVQMCDQCDQIYSGQEFKKLPTTEKKKVCLCGSTKWVSHFATFPERLVEPLVLASTSEHGCCANCGAPYERIVEEQLPAGDAYAPTEGEANATAKWARGNAGNARNGDNPHTFSQVTGSHHRSGPPAPLTIGWLPTCTHPLFPAAVVPCIVLDPFAGSGRTGIAAERHKRDFIGIDSNQKYVAIANWQRAREKSQCVSPVLSR